MSRSFNTILVTGGCGFIGSNFINYLFGKSTSPFFLDSNFTGKVVNVDSLTYAGNIENLKEVQKEFGGKRYFFERVDITNRSEIERIFKQYDVDAVVHFAAESHVDRSILGPGVFLNTNIIGTYTLLDVARIYWGCSLDNARTDVLFHHISTDEVYGTLGETGFFYENTSYAPRSPYSASKASSDHLVMAYHHTFGLPITLSNCSNNYGPYQFPEKLIPLMILNITEGKSLPVYGEGKNIRDWIYVEDHNRAVWSIIKDGTVGQKYNIGGENEWRNIDLLHKLIEVTAEITNKDIKTIENTITHVKDRPGHDARYAIDCTKIKNELKWERKMPFEEGLSMTVKWYLNNKEWVNHIQSGEYMKWLEKNYSER